MIHASRYLGALALAVLVGACHARRPQTAIGAASPMASTAIQFGLTGRWDFRMVLPERNTLGEIWLFERGGNYTGTVTPQGTNTLPIRSLVVKQSTVAMTVDTPEGPVTFDGVVDSSGSTIQGILTYHAGQKYPMEAKRKATNGR